MVYIKQEYITIPNFVHAVSLKNGTCGCRGVPGTEHKVQPAQTIVSVFKISLGPFQHKPSKKDIEYDPHAHNITATKKITNAQPGWPVMATNNAKMVPKKARSDPMLFLSAICKPNQGCKNHCHKHQPRNNDFNKHCAA